MQVSKDWLSLVRNLYNDLLAGEIEDRFGLAESAAKTSVLPLAADMGGFFGVHLDGEILGFIYGELDQPIKVEDVRIYNSVLFQGSKVYDRLSGLAPTRSDDDLTCPYCNGSGIVEDYPGLESRLVCFCGGLGWIPPTGSHPAK